MHLTDIFEARSHPDVNTALRPRDVVKAVEPFFFRDDAYLSMLNLQKVGVHPNTPYDSTPAGVYAYPLGEQYIVSQFLKDSLPHAGWAKYATVMIRKPGINMLTDGMSKADLAPYGERLDEMVEARFDGRAWRDVKAAALDINHRNIQKDAHQFYRETEAAAVLFMLLKSHTPAQLKASLASSMDRYMWKRNAARPRIWNGILRKLGFEAVDDRGSSMIFNVEPFQICFLSTAAISNFEMFRNGRSSIYAHDNEIKSAGHFFRLVKDGDIDGLQGLKIINAILKGQEMPDVSRLGGYDPNIRFSDGQLRTYVQWLRDTREEDFYDWVLEHKGPWGINAPRLRAALGL